MSLGLRFRRLLRTRGASIEKSKAAVSPQGLESKIDSLERIAHICTIAVIAGVMLEYVPKFVAFARTPGWTLFKDLSGGLLIALGIAGEVLASMLSSRKEQQLRDLNATTIAELNQQAEHDRFARVKIEERLRRRALSEETKLALIGLLKPFKGTSVDIVVFDKHIAEVALLADAVIRLFIVAGWEPQEFAPNVGRMLGGGTGMQFRVSAGDKQQALWSLAEDAIRTLLKNDGIAASLDFLYFSDPNAPQEKMFTEAWYPRPRPPLRIQISEKPVSLEP